MGLEQPEDPRRLEARNAVLELFPELKQLFEFQQQGGFNEALEGGRAYWTGHALNMSRALASSFAEQTGRDVRDLSPGHVKRFAGALRDFCNDDRSGERWQRYDEGDLSLVDECLEDLMGFYVTPRQTAVTTTNAQQVERTRRLPQQGVRTAPPAPQVQQTEGQPRFANKKERFRAMRQALLDQQPA
jgi:hypothetical protein